LGTKRREDASNKLVDGETATSVYENALTKEGGGITTLQIEKRFNGRNKRKKKGEEM